jgi:cytochrome c-type biogenesis protein CcmH
MKLFLIIFMSLMLSITALAQDPSQQIYSFESPVLQQRFENITHELRCLVCQNESIAESTAPLAKDLRDEVYRKMQEGYSDSEVKDYLVDRYGEFVLFKPAFSISNLALWTFPFLLLIAGLLILFLFSGRKRTDGQPRLSDKDQQKIDELMGAKDK